MVWTTLSRHPNNVVLLFEVGILVRVGVLVQLGVLKRLSDLVGVKLLLCNFSHPKGVDQVYGCL